MLVFTYIIGSENFREAWSDQLLCTLNKKSEVVQGQQKVALNSQKCPFSGIWPSALLMWNASKKK